MDGVVQLVIMYMGSVIIGVTWALECCHGCYMCLGVLL